MWGVVKGFQTACNLAGPPGDLAGKGDQPSRKVVHKKGTRQMLDTTRGQPAPLGPNGESAQGCLVWSIYEPPGDWTGTGDQPSGKGCWSEVLDEPRRQPARCQPARNQNNQRGTHRGVLVGQSGIVRIHITL